MPIFDLESIERDEQVGAVSHKRDIGALHREAHHTTRFRVEHEMMHLANALRSLSLLPRLMNGNPMKLTDKIFAFLH